MQKQFKRPWADEAASPLWACHQARYMLFTWYSIRGTKKPWPTLSPLQPVIKQNICYMYNIPSHDIASQGSKSLCLLGSFSWHRLSLSSSKINATCTTSLHMTKHHRDQRAFGVMDVGFGCFGGGGMTLRWQIGASTTHQCHPQLHFPACGAFFTPSSFSPSFFPPRHQPVHYQRDIYSTWPLVAA